ncbi:MAG TPA: protein kinase [Terriglobia bacterium]|nr:protein kinase [Terriglobia bacterium]
MWIAGQVVNDRYRILAAAAKGDLRPAYRALDERSGKTCALEFVALDPAKERGWRESLELEIEKLRALENPLILTPDSIEAAPGGLLIVRKFFEGCTLEDVIRQQAPLALPDACFIARRVAMALEAAHHAGIIHGDLKPSNILLVREKSKDQVKVLGLGTFGLKKDFFINMARLALNGDTPVLGNPEYISPEQALGTDAEALDGRTDIYSLGVILYQTLSGGLPFKGGNPMDLLLAHVFAAPPSLAQFPELEIPEVVDSLVLRCLAKKREDRPPSATVLVDQLGPWEDRQPIPASPEAEPKAVPIVEETVNAAHRASVLESPVAEAAVAPFEVTEPLEAAPAFVADLDAPPRAEPVILDSTAAQEPAWAQPLPEPPPLDVALDHPDPGPTVAVFQKDSPPRPTSSPGPDIFKSYMPRQKINRPTKTWTKWIWAVAALVLLSGGGYGWIVYTGRTYWLRSQFLQRRVSTFLSGFSAEGANGDSSAVKQAPNASASSPFNALPPNQAPTEPVAPASSLPPASGPALSPNASTPITPVAPTQPGPGGSPVAADNAGAQEAIKQGESYFERGDYNDAIRVYQTGLAKDPSNSKLLADIARARKAKAAEAEILGK